MLLALSGHTFTWAPVDVGENHRLRLSATPQRNRVCYHRLPLEETAQEQRWPICRLRPGKLYLDDHTPRVRAAIFRVALRGCLAVGLVDRSIFVSPTDWPSGRSRPDRQPRSRRVRVREGGQGGFLLGCGFIERTRAVLCDKVGFCAPSISA